MSKTWYNKITGYGGVFDDAEDIANWPDFQETKPLPTEAQVRADRDERLSASDTMALADRITDAWRTYRQALRDVPDQSGFPTNVIWPVEPI
tara:strand:+ start:884 stop:1159 length:276 start_codon:yes stop_codon:yes gene_type:complete